MCSRSAPRVLSREAPSVDIVDLRWIWCCRDLPALLRSCWPGWGSADKKGDKGDADAVRLQPTG